MGLMEQHVKILGMLHVILSGMGVLGALAIFFLFGGLAGLVGIAQRSPDAAFAVPFLGGLGTILCVVILVFSVPGLIGGIGLLNMAHWSRVWMIVISALDLISVPFGTALGIYGLWALTKPETEALFARRAYQRY